MKIRCLIEELDVSVGEVFELHNVRDPDGNPVGSGDFASIEFIEVKDRTGFWWPLLAHEFEVIDE